MRAVSDRQVRTMMEEMNKHGKIGKSAMKAGMDRKTARKYLHNGKLPSELSSPRDWRTREDPFEEHWAEIVESLEESPELEAKTILQQLEDKYPERYDEGNLRTLQRRVRDWRAQHGPDKNVVLAQRHRPGEATQLDFTHAEELGVTIMGQLFLHLLCVVTLPFSNWRWATVCLSESIASIRKGFQRAIFQIGRVPEYNQTDNSTGATHRIGEAQRIERADGREREFNEDYLALMGHYDVKPRTTQVGEKVQNGDVEASNGAIKRQLKQALLVRGSRDFESVEAWQRFIDDVQRKSNARRPKLAEELEAMRELRVEKLAEFTEERVVVSEWSTIRIKHCAYSVPSRTIGHELRVLVFEDRIEAYLGKTSVLSCERIRARGQNRIDYHHVIESLLRKPGGFARYVYREEMFPSLVFRQAYDAILDRKAGTKADLEYLRILYLAATTLESDVEMALKLLLDEKQPISVEEVKELVVTREPIQVPALAVRKVDLACYNDLISEVA